MTQETPDQTKTVAAGAAPPVDAEMVQYIARNMTMFSPDSAFYKGHPWVRPIVDAIHEAEEQARAAEKPRARKRRRSKPESGPPAPSRFVTDHQIADLRARAAAGEKLKPILIGSYGLQLKVTRRQALWRLVLHGRTTRPLGSYPKLSIAEAMKLARTDQEWAWPVTDPPPIRDLLEIYNLEQLSDQASHAPTLRALKRVFADDMDRQADEIEYDELLVRLDVLGHEAPQLARRASSSVNRFLEWANKAGYAAGRLYVRADLPPRSQPRYRHLRNRDLSVIWSAAGDLPYPFGPALRLHLNTGIHLEDITAMAVSDLQLMGRSPRWRVPASPTNPEPQTIFLTRPLHKLVKAAIAMAKPGSDLVFSRTGGNQRSGWPRAKAKLDGLIAARLQAWGDEEMKPWQLRDIRRTIGGPE